MKQFAEFCLDQANECLWRNGARIVLAPKPFAVLRYLVEHPGRLVTHDELLDAVWPETYVQPQILRTYMLDLRKVLGDDAREPRFIESLPKRGYCFLAEVRETAARQDDRGLARETAAEDRDMAVLMGREEELASLAAHLRLAHGGSRQVVFLCGETGIGKTALLEAFCAGAQRDAATVVGVGQCVQGFAARQDYYPILNALEKLCAADPEVRTRLAAAAPAWVNSDGDATVAHGAGAASRTPGELCAALESLAHERLVILVVEDAHWADDATLDLLAALAQRRCPAKLMILASATLQGGSAPQRLKQLMHDLLIRRLATELTVARLGRHAMAQLLRARLGVEELPPALLDLVHMRSEGNPMFARAMIEHLIAEQMLVCQCKDGSWELRGAVEQIEASVPHELARMIELELEHLSAEERRLLEAGSLISVAFPAWAVAAALNESLAGTEEACDELSRRFAFVKRVGEDELPDGTRSTFYAFAHGLYRDALYQRQSPARRAERHVCIAERLRTLFPGREELVASEMALHYEAACAWQSALETLRLAEGNAIRRQARGLAGELREQAERIATRLQMRQLTAGEPAAGAKDSVESGLDSIARSLTNS